jgi:leucyl-tRNA synthetase
MIEGCHRFLGRVWRLATGSLDRATVSDREPAPADEALDKETHRLIDRITSDFERWSYNTAVAACMEFVNGLYRYVQSEEGGRRATLDFAIDSLLMVLAPMAPHISAELWERRHPGRSPVHAQPWPVADAGKVRMETVTMVVQVNGKVRDRLDVPTSISEDEAVAASLASPRIVDALAGRPARKIVARPPRLVNLVV